MNALPVIVNRLVALVVAAILIVIGGAAITWKLNTPWIHDHMERIDLHWFAKAPQQNWWVWALVIALIVLLILGLWLLALNVRPRKVGTIALAGSDKTGLLTLQPARLAGAVADDLAAAPEIVSAKAKALDDRKRDLLQITVVADPSTSYDDVLGHVRKSEHQLHTALQGSGLRPQFLLHMEKPKVNTARVQ